jgi:hypothetical protein
MKGLLECFPTDQYAPWAGTVPSQVAAGETVLAPWLDPRVAASAGLCPPPKWHIPTADEVAFAKELLDLHMFTALQQLEAFCINKSLPPVGPCHTHKELAIQKKDRHHFNYECSLW